MLFLGLKIANQTGMLPGLHKDKPLYLIRTAINLISAASIMVHSFWFYISAQEENFVHATFALGVSVNVIMHLVKAFIGLSKNKQFLKMYFRLKSFYDNPAQYRREFRDQIDRQLHCYGLFFARFMVLACFVVVLTPVLVKALEYYQTGAIANNRWDLPIPYASPFYDFDTSPEYEICYVVFALSFVPAVFFLFSLAFLFMGICGHIYGLFMELETRFKNVGVSLKESRVNKRKFRENYKNCIDFQNEIYEIVKDTQEVFANIFFVQFMGTIIIVCVQSYVATQNTSNGRLISNLFYSVVGAGELFLFTICGSLITQGNELSIRALLDNDWIHMDPSIRRDFAFMVKRSQKLCRISFLNWIDCSLESLKFVVTSSFNMFAMLQHIARRKGGRY